MGQSTRWENPSRSTSAGAHPCLDIPFDTLGVRRGGGDNGEKGDNGVCSVRAARRTGEFCRVRCCPGPYGMCPTAHTVQVIVSSPFDHEASVAGTGVVPPLAALGCLGLDPATATRGSSPGWTSVGPSTSPTRSGSTTRPIHRGRDGGADHRGPGLPQVAGHHRVGGETSTQVELAFTAALRPRACLRPSRPATTTAG